MKKGEIIDYFLALVEAVEHSSEIKTSDYGVNIKLNNQNFYVDLLLEANAIRFDGFFCNLNKYDRDMLFKIAQEKYDEVYSKEQKEKIDKIKEFTKSHNTKRYSLLPEEVSDLLYDAYANYKKNIEYEFDEAFRTGTVFDKHFLNYNFFLNELRDNEVFQQKQGLSIKENILQNNNIEITINCNGKTIKNVLGEI